jgi:hypothetical protein
LGCYPEGLSLEAFKDFSSQSHDETLPNRVTHEVSAVLNVAVGAEHHLGKRFTLYGSFWMDFSSRKDGSSSNLSVSDWGLYHFMGGTTFEALGSQFTLGVGYAYGSRKQKNGQLYSDSSLGNIANAVFSDLKYSYSSFRWILGFSF